jgi:hypothetical protein
MHPPELKQAALDLIAAGHNDCEVAPRLGVPRRTIMDWRRPTYEARPRATCPRCWRAGKPMAFTPERYTELLGLYLGDGYISAGPRTFRLRITLDAEYPNVIEEAALLIRRSMPQNEVDIDAGGVKGKCVNVSVYSQHLPCLLPQHGPGKKHERRIVLESWQRDLLNQAPWGFLRGCIRSDGCAFVNRTGPYQYLSYDFSNRSKDIADLFCGACDLAGVTYRLTGNPRRKLWDVRINRRASVDLMEMHVGLKS